MPRKYSMGITTQPSLYKADAIYIYVCVCVCVCACVCVCVCDLKNITVMDTRRGLLKVSCGVHNHQTEMSDD